MQFAHPETLPWLGAVLAASLAALLAARLLAARRRVRLLGPGAGRPAWHADARRAAALALVAVALAGPQWGERSVRLPASGVDVVLLLDVSRSMLARDVPPSRLARARQTAAEVLGRLAAGDRAALAAFAGRGVLLTPLTPDHAALVEMLPAFDPDLMGLQGSRLRSGVRAALGAFPEASARPRLLLVLSDGESPVGSSPTGAEDAAAAGVRVVAAAYGSEAGAEIPDPPGVLRDARGETVVTRRDAARLATLGEATDGALLRADRWGAVDAEALVAALRRDALAAPDGFVERRQAVTHTAPFAALALLLLLAGALPARRRPGRRDAPAGAWPVVAAAGLALTLLGAGHGDEPDAETLLRRGVERADAGDWVGAEHAFFAAALHAEDAELATDAYYDLGVAALGRGDFARARDAFFDAIALSPRDREAQFNLEWTLRRMAAEPSAAGEPPRRPAPPRPEESPSDEAGEGEAEARERGREEGEELEERLDARPQPAEEPATESGAQAAPALSEDEAARWLGRVQDDPARALRAAARAGEAQRDPRRAPPAW